jgi:hypothetical protein
MVRSSQNTDSISTEYFFVEHLMLFVAAPNAHTYRLLIFKDLVLHAAKRFVRQRRRKSMKRLQHFVNLLFFSLHSAFACFVSRGTEL